MTLREFENRYWYLVDLKVLAASVGIPSAGRLRKDELEKAVAAYLRTGKADLPTTRALKKSGVKDLEGGLSLKRRIIHYTSNRATKDFIRREADRIAPGLRAKSGVWYRLNRWREEQITTGKRLTYGDLVRRYVALNRLEQFEKIPQARYINFLAAFHAAEKGASRRDALAAWEELKALDSPKTYASWRAARPLRARRSRP